jgi:hypothetical protein
MWLVIVVVSLALLSPASAANCPGANPNDNLPDDDVLQACLNQGGTVQLDPGSPGYIIAKGLTLAVNSTVLTSAKAPAQATLIADPSLHAPLLKVPDGTINYRVDSILFDGNRQRRDASVCSGYRDPFASNVQLNGSGFIVINIESARALCGSSLVISGSDFEIANSSFHDNGASQGAPEPWSDGITLARCTRGYVHNNTLANNTDVDIVNGGGPDCRIENNTIQHTTTHGFAGLAIHKFPGTGGGDHRGSVFQNNTISSAPNQLELGISVGMNPWGVSGTVSGSIINNIVSGAQVNLAVDGYSNGTVNNNALSNPQGGCALNYTVSNTTNVCLQPGWAVKSVQLGTMCTDTEQVITSTCTVSTPPASSSGLRISETQ